ncbi:hypothetical protein SLS62_004846 [Diatrype stigma]|uniref:Pentatricopeptide repeat domain-containing protein n=1 Tax=Diatrype stigma TaxID=117547 RepID=A0AAN9UVR9_9PEZI
MRLATRPFRDLKFIGSVLDLRLHPRPRPRRGQALGRIVQLGKQQDYGYPARARCYSVPAAHSEAVVDVPSSPVVLDDINVSVGPPEQPPSSTPLRSLIQSNELFGRWRALLRDSSRLAIESDFAREGPAKEWNGPLLVDKLEHRGDLALWNCLLDYQTRINGVSGPRKVWRAIWGRKSLYDIKSPLAPVFWQTILDAAVRSDDRKFLQDVYIYSEWMHETHGVKWPHLYLTVMTHLLKTHQHHLALQWHLRLVPTFYPGPEEFAEFLKQFAGEPVLYRSLTLQSLYILNPNRQLYDKLVPYLYGRGQSAFAIAWRDVFIQYDDLPLSPVLVRPFLRYLKGYFPKRPLHPEEAAAIDLDHTFAEDEGEKAPDLDREFMNRLDGETFGISVKDYNDELGAKWFASSWISLDTAIAAVAALGIEQIGPLSLQSIALRESTSEGVSKRINQLQQKGITVVPSNYFRILQYFVKIQDDELLFDLLQSDFHPDVFEDALVLAQALESTMASDDWRTYRLLLTARVIIMQKTARETANSILHTYFLNLDQQGLFRVLDDMRMMNIGIDRKQAAAIFELLGFKVRVHRFKPDSIEMTGFYLRLCLRLVSMEIPVPVACWKQIVTSLGKQGCLDDMESLCLELATLFTTSPPSSRPGFMPVHLDDIPEPMKQPLAGVENLLGVYVPGDLPSSVVLHPLRQIFDENMINGLVRWTFAATLSGTGSARAATLINHPRRPADFHCGRAVRLLRMLRDRGVFIRKSEVLKAVMNRLVDLYGTAVHTKADHFRSRANNILSLAEMKALLDRAWGVTHTHPGTSNNNSNSDGDSTTGTSTETSSDRANEFLPPLEELRAEIEERGGERSEKNLQYLTKRGKRIRDHLPVL